MWHTIRERFSLSTTTTVIVVTTYAALFQLRRYDRYTTGFLNIKYNYLEFFFSVCSFVIRFREQFTSSERRATTTHAYFVKKI